MPGPSRFLSIAVGTAAVMWLAAYALQVSPVVLKRDAIVFGIIGVLVAAAVEAIVKRRRAAEPAPRVAGNATATAATTSATHAAATREE